MRLGFFSRASVRRTAPLFWRRGQEAPHPASHRWQLIRAASSGHQIAPGSVVTLRWGRLHVLDMGRGNWRLTYGSPCRVPRRSPASMRHSGASQEAHVNLSLLCREPEVALAGSGA